LPFTKPRLNADVDIDPTSATSTAPTPTPMAAPPTASPTSTPTTAYYYDVTTSDSPTASPAATATFEEDNDNHDATRNHKTTTYRPGRLTVKENGMLLAEGLTSRIVAQAGQRVRLANGQRSKAAFHLKPDGAAIFEDVRDNNANGNNANGNNANNANGFVYVSNSEKGQNEGGVGALRFNANYQVTDYYTILEHTSRNCQGGKMPWNTWVSCEENSAKDGHHNDNNGNSNGDGSGNKNEHNGGQCYETDPFGRRKATKTSLGGPEGGRFESVALDDRDAEANGGILRFFVTHDSTYGELRRYTPPRRAVRRALRRNSYWDILHSPGGTLEYLVLEPDENEDNNESTVVSTSFTSGTYRWTTDIQEGKRSASLHFKKCEGMEIEDNILYFVSAKQQEIFMLNLDDFTYRKQYTTSPQFQGQPDGLHFMDITKTDETNNNNHNNNNHRNSILYITEEGKDGNKAGIYGRDADDSDSETTTDGGQLFTVMKSLQWWGDTTGLAFSPDQMRMYFAIQTDGVIVELRRTDGQPFDGHVMDVRYHAQATKLIF
jgi:hypothetical protein